MSIRCARKYATAGGFVRGTCELCGRGPCQWPNDTATPPPEDTFMTAPFTSTPPLMTDLPDSVPVPGRGAPVAAFPADLRLRKLESLRDAFLAELRAIPARSDATLQAEAKVREAFMWAKEALPRA